MNAPLLGLYGVSWSYADRKILDDVSFELEAGEILALLGPNGSGKSTLLKVLAGILPLPSGAGVLRYQGSDLSSLDAASRARKVSYLSAGIRADFPMSALETVKLGRICHGSGLLRQYSRADEEAVQWAMNEALCWGLRDRDLATLSGGERQLVGLARSLAQGSKVLLLDEALSKMDLNHLALIGRMLKRRAAEGWGVILVSHDVHVAAEISRSCLLLKGGRRIAHGKIREVLTQSALGALYPGADLRVEAHPVTGAPRISFGD